MYTNPHKEEATHDNDDNKAAGVLIWRLQHVTDVTAIYEIFCHM